MDRVRTTARGFPFGALFFPAGMGFTPFRSLALLFFGLFSPFFPRVPKRNGGKERGKEGLVWSGLVWSEPSADEEQ